MKQHGQLSCNCVMHDGYNSGETFVLRAGVFLQTFKRLSRRGIMPEVLHPAVQPPSDEALAESDASWQSELGADLAGALAGKRVFLSINRFERKKVQGVFFCFSF